MKELLPWTIVTVASIATITLLFIANFVPHTISNTAIERAIEVCSNHSGIRRIEHYSRAIPTMTVYCNNDTVFTVVAK